MPGAALRMQDRKPCLAFRVETPGRYEFEVTGFRPFPASPSASRIIPIGGGRRREGRRAADLCAPACWPNDWRDHLAPALADPRNGVQSPIVRRGLERFQRVDVQVFMNEPGKGRANSRNVLK